MLYIEVDDFADSNQRLHLQSDRRPKSASS